MRLTGVKATNVSTEAASLVLLAMTVTVWKVRKLSKILSGSVGAGTFLHLFLLLTGATSNRVSSLTWDNSMFQTAYTGSMKLVFYGWDSLAWSTTSGSVPALHLIVKFMFWANARTSHSQWEPAVTGNWIQVSTGAGPQRSTTELSHYPSIPSVNDVLFQCWIGCRLHRQVLWYWWG